MAARFKLTNKHLLIAGLLVCGGAYLYFSQSREEVEEEPAAKKSTAKTIPQEEYAQPVTSPTPPSMVQLNNQCCKLFLTADYLLWTAHQDNMSYAYPVNELHGGVSATIKSKVHYPHYEWSSGFRVGAGLNFAHDNWDTYVNYTWFHPSKATDSENQPDTAATLVPAWPINLPGDTLLTYSLNHADISWGFDFDNVDWELGRNFYVSRFLTLRPFMGLQSAWQKQTLSIKFDSADLELGAEKGFTNFTMETRQDYWGIGALIGLDTAWYVYKKSFSIVGDLALSALWGRYKHTQKQHEEAFDTTNTPTTFTDVLLVNFEDSYDAIKPVIRFDIGLQWEKWFDHDKKKFAIQALWEEQIWINQNTLPEALLVPGVYPSPAAVRAVEYAKGGSGTYKARGGDLFIQGLTLRARYDF